MDKQPLTEGEIQQKIHHDQEVMKGWKVAAIPCSSPADNDAELSEGEFMQKSNHQRDEYLRKRAGLLIVREAKKRLKKATREQKRLGGPIILWTFKDVKKGRTIMAQKEEIAAEAAEEKEKAKEAKAKAKAKKKPAKKAKKGKKEKKEKKGGKARRPRVVDGKITLLEKTNPKRKGSKAYKRYELYTKHKTIAKYLDAGGKRSSLRYDEKHGFIKTSGTTTSEDVKKDKKEK